MQPLASLDLAHLPMDEPGFAQNPLPHFAVARRKHPWLAKCAFGYVVHEYGAIKDLLWMDDKMRSAFEGVVEQMGAKGTAWGRFTEDQLLAHWGASHKRMRDVLAPAFTPRQANLNRPLMREVVSGLLDEWAPRAAFDFEEFASYFPISVMCRMIGAPPDIVPSIRSSLEALGLGFSMNPGHLPALLNAIVVLDQFVQKLVSERRAGGRPAEGRDLLDILLEANGEGGLTDRELYDLLIFLFVGGYDTSKNVLTLTMHTLLDRPEIYERCARDYAFCSKLIEESLRYHSPATSFRVTGEDIVYRDVLLPKGSMLFFPLSIAGRDPGAVPDADRFNPERTHENRHMAFGRGMHICLGQFIARAQLEEGLHLIAQRLRKPKLAGPVGWRPFFGVWGLRGLPITFEPAPAQTATA